MNEPKDNLSKARESLLEEIKALSGGHHDSKFSRHAAIYQTSKKLGPESESNVFEAWDELYRAGVISYGFDLANIHNTFEWARLTQRGADAVKELSRDPSNTRGYLQVIGPSLKDRGIAESYLVEALETYNRGCDKAAAVMLGCAAESLNLDLRNRLAAKVGPDAGLDDWRVAKVLRAIAGKLQTRIADMPRALRERFEAHWPSWSGLFRMTRNEVGHPSNIEPVTHDQVHAALLMFHEQARLCRDLAEWIDVHF